jgi:glycosyltransferase involved in cell wall biosynthesis
MSKSIESARVAFVHDWLVGMRGGERVLEAMIEQFPHAPIYTLIADVSKLSPALQQREIVTSWLQKIPGIHKNYRYFLPLMPLAIRSFDLSEFDLILSSSHCVAKGVQKRIDSVHVSYVNAPMRYMWSRFNDYFGVGRAGVLTRLVAIVLRPFLQSWDRSVSVEENVDVMFGNSHYIAQEIRAVYGREAQVIFPFGDFSRFKNLSRDRKDFYLVAGAFAPYKRVDIAIEACEKLGRRLIVAGAGQEEGNLKSGMEK